MKRKFTFLVNLAVMLVTPVLVLASVPQCRLLDYQGNSVNNAEEVFCVADTLETEAIPFHIVDKKPKFNNSDVDAFSKWVNSQLVYPEIAKENGEQGKVMLSFTIGLDGSICDVSILKGVSPSLDAEAIRVVSKSPKWTPGEHNGKNIPVSFVYPVMFNIEDLNPVIIPFQLVDEKPKFKKRGSNAFSKWVNSQLIYPEIAKENGMQGRVTLQFTIDVDGSVTNVKVLRGVDPSLDKEAVRVISKSPKWTPAKVKGKAVSVTYTFPVIFRLR